MLEEGNAIQNWLNAPTNPPWETVFDKADFTFGALTFAAQWTHTRVFFSRRFYILGMKKTVRSVDCTVFSRHSAKPSQILGQLALEQITLCLKRLCWTFASQIWDGP